MRWYKIARLDQAKKKQRKGGERKEKELPYSSNGLKKYYSFIMNNLTIFSL
jgi:hypothetical protein